MAIHNYTGPTQSGKTLDAFLIPIFYCVFEKEEDAIVGLPTMELSMKKWRKDILPIIQRTRYARYLRSKGRGSHGGDFTEITVGNGVTLTFMSFHGDDKKWASETASNLIITDAVPFFVAQDPLTGKDFEHRRLWARNSRDRSSFIADGIGFAVLVRSVSICVDLCRSVSICVRLMFK